MARRRIADSDDEEGDEQQQGSSRGRQAGSTGANGNGAMEVEGEDDHAQDEGDDQDDSEDQVVSGNAGSGRASKRRRNNGAGSATPRRNRSASDPETPNSAARRPKTYLGERDEAGCSTLTLLAYPCTDRPGQLRARIRGAHRMRELSHLRLGHHTAWSSSEHDHRPERDGQELHRLRHRPRTRFQASGTCEDSAV